MKLHQLIEKIYKNTGKNKYVFNAKGDVLLLGAPNFVAFSLFNLVFFDNALI